MELSLSDSDLLEDTEDDLEMLCLGVRMTSEVSWALSSCSWTRLLAHGDISGRFGLFCICLYVVTVFVIINYLSDY